MNCPATPAGGGSGMKGRNPFSPKTKKDHARQISGDSGSRSHNLVLLFDLVNSSSSARSGRCVRPQHESRWHTSVATAVPSQVAESKRSSDQSGWRKFASGEILDNPIGGR